MALGHTPWRRLLSGLLVETTERCLFNPLCPPLLGDEKGGILGTPRTPAASCCTCSWLSRWERMIKEDRVYVLRHSRAACPREDGERESMSVLGGPRSVVAAEPGCGADRAKRNQPASFEESPSTPFILIPSVPLLPKGDSREFEVGAPADFQRETSLTSSQRLSCSNRRHISSPSRNWYYMP